MAKTLTGSGRDPADYRVGIIRSCLVTDDRERDWPAVRDGERRRMAVYSQFRDAAGGHGGVAGITEEERIPQTWVVGDVDHCVTELAAFIREYGLTDIVTWARAARHAAGADGTKPGTFRPRRGAAAAGDVSGIAPHGAIRAGGTASRAHPPSLTGYIRSASMMAWAKAWGASCGRLCPIPPPISRCS